MPEAGTSINQRSLRRALNLVWLILALLYGAIALSYIWIDRPPLSSLEDYRAIYASAQIALKAGFAEVYDLQTQDQYQAVLQNQSPARGIQYHKETVPMPFLPAFVLLFTPLPALGYTLGYIVWNLANLALLILYFIHFTRRLGKENGRDILFQLLLCLPMASNLIFGQVNVLLLVCLGQFLLACQERADWRGGLWLGGLLLKPQVLILLLPGLLLRKRYKTLSGFAVSSAFLLGVSLLLVGPNGLGDQATLILSYARGIPSNAPEAMMNFRAVAVNLSNIFPGIWVWVLALAGMAVTALIVLRLWTLPVESDSPHFALLILATMAGTFSVTWHAHNHMEVVLIPLVLYLYARQRLPLRLLYFWLLASPLYLAVIALISPSSAYNLFGLGTLGINLTLLGWAAWRLQRSYAPHFQPSNKELV